MSKVVIETSELARIIREGVRSTLLGHADNIAPKGYTIAATRRGPELMPLAAGELEYTFMEIGRNVAALVAAEGIEIDFNSAGCETDPSWFVEDLRDRWSTRKEGS